MKDCCEVTADYTARQRRVLRVVLWINIVMFLVEATAGLLRASQVGAIKGSTSGNRTFIAEGT